MSIDHLVPAGSNYAQNKAFFKYTLAPLELGLER